MSKLKTKTVDEIFHIIGNACLGEDIDRVMCASFAMALECAGRLENKDAEKAVILADEVWETIKRVAIKANLKSETFFP